MLPFHETLNLQVGDPFNGGTIAELSRKFNGNWSVRYAYGPDQYNSTIDEWTRNTCGG